MKWKFTGVRSQKFPLPPSSRSQSLFVLPFRRNRPPIFGIVPSKTGSSSRIVQSGELAKADSDYIIVRKRRRLHVAALKFNDRQGSSKERGKSSWKLQILHFWRRRECRPVSWIKQRKLSRESHRSRFQQIPKDVDDSSPDCFIVWKMMKNLSSRGKGNQRRNGGSFHFVLLFPPPPLAFNSWFLFNFPHGAQSSWIAERRNSRLVWAT